MSTGEYLRDKKIASKKVKGYVDWLKKNPENAMKLSTIAIEFQESYGLGYLTTKNLFKPYTEAKIIQIDGDEINARESKV